MLNNCSDNSFGGAGAVPGVFCAGTVTGQPGRLGIRLGLRSSVGSGNLPLRRFRPPHVRPGSRRSLLQRARRQPLREGIQLMCTTPNRNTPTETHSKKKRKKKKEKYSQIIWNKFSSKKERILSQYHTLLHLFYTISTPLLHLPTPSLICCTTRCTRSQVTEWFHPEDVILFILATWSNSFHAIQIQKQFQWIVSRWMGALAVLGSLYVIIYWDRWSFSSVTPKNQQKNEK